MVNKNKKYQIKRKKLQKQLQNLAKAFLLYIFFTSRSILNVHEANPFNNILKKYDFVTFKKLLQKRYLLFIYLPLLFKTFTTEFTLLWINKEKYPYKMSLEGERNSLKNLSMNYDYLSSTVSPTLSVPSTVPMCRT